ncbi:membrane protein [Sesbania bispinosa]|nr:membrane protein [Sesbania bispinosa]
MRKSFIRKMSYNNQITNAEGTNHPIRPYILEDWTNEDGNSEELSNLDPSFDEH